MEIIALDRPRTQQQRPESPTVTPPAMQVNFMQLQGTITPPNIHLQKNKKKMPTVAYTPSISGTLGDTGVYRHKTEPILI